MKHSTTSVHTNTDGRHVSSRQGLDGDCRQGGNHTHRELWPTWPSSLDTRTQSRGVVREADCGEVPVLTFPQQEALLRNTYSETRIPEGLWLNNRP